MEKDGPQSHSTYLSHSTYQSSLLADYQYHETKSVSVSSDSDFAKSPGTSDDVDLAGIMRPPTPLPVVSPILRPCAALRRLSYASLTSGGSLAPSLQIETQYGYTNPYDTRLIHLLEMGFQEGQCELALDRLDEGEPLEQAIAWIINPPDDLRLQFRAIEALNAQNEARKLSMQKRRLEFYTKAAWVMCDSEHKEKEQFCVICMENKPRSEFVDASCGHNHCSPCLREHYRVKISDGEVVHLTCVECSRNIPEREILRYIGGNKCLLDKYYRFKQNAELAENPHVRWCWTPGCETALHAPSHVKSTAAASRISFDSQRTCPSTHKTPLLQIDEQDAKLDCSKCKNSTCFLCGNPWHEDRTCDQAVDAKFNKWAKQMKKDRSLQQCIRCGARIWKNGGCNHMTCTVCRFQFCWLCGQEYRPGHYDRIRGQCPGAQFMESNGIGCFRRCCYPLYARCADRCDNCPKAMCWCLGCLVCCPVMTFYWGVVCLGGCDE